MSFREARSSQIYLFVEVLMIFEGSVVLFEDLINQDIQNEHIRGVISVTKRCVLYGNDMVSKDRPIEGYVTLDIRINHNSIFAYPDSNHDIP